MNPKARLIQEIIDTITSDPTASNALKDFILQTIQDAGVMTAVGLEYKKPEKKGTNCNGVDS